MTSRCRGAAWSLRSPAWDDPRGVRPQLPADRPAAVGPAAAHPVMLCTGTALVLAGTGMPAQARRHIQAAADQGRFDVADAGVAVAWVGAALLGPAPGARRQPRSRRDVAARRDGQACPAHARAEAQRRRRAGLTPAARAAARLTWACSRRRAGTGGPGSAPRWRRR